MTKEFIFPTGDDWNWSEKSPFVSCVAVGDQVFISGQQTLNANGSVRDPGNIAAQTRNVFENMKRSLAKVGLQLSDLVRLNTYYVYDGSDDDATQYWEDMTRVRLEYFPDPGPAATAVRVKGMPYKGQLIQIEGIALRGRSRENRKRIMPKGSWDWSIAVPLSQGWEVDERIYVGGQISSDEEGKSVHVGDVAAQTRNIYRFIGNVLRDAGSSFDDVVHVKICFKHDSRDQSGEAFSEKIMEVSKEFFTDRAPVMTAFGVDLLYPGLDLEIDAMAIRDPLRRSLYCADLGGRYQPKMFSDGVAASNEVYVAGQTALAEDGSVIAVGDVSSQAGRVFERLAKVLAEDDCTLDDVVKLNLFIVGDGEDIADEFHKVSKEWARIAPNAHPAMTPVRVHELAVPGLLVQADCVAMK